MKKNTLTIGTLIVTFFFMNCRPRDEFDSANTSYSNKDSSGIHHKVDTTHSNVDHSTGDQGIDATDSSKSSH
jgi:hypothetical protein